MVYTTIWYPATECVSQITVCRNYNPVLSSFITHHRIFTKSNTAAPLVNRELPNFPEYPDLEFTHSFLWSSCCSIFSFLFQCSVCIVVLSLLTFVLSILHLFTDSDNRLESSNFFLNRSMFYSLYIFTILTTFNYRYIL